MRRALRASSRRIARFGAGFALATGRSSLCGPRRARDRRRRTWKSCARTTAASAEASMILVASIVVFCDYSFLLGPAIVGVLSRLLRRHSISANGSGRRSRSTSRAEVVGHARRHRPRSCSSRRSGRTSRPSSSLASVCMCAAATYLAEHAAGEFRGRVVNQEPTRSVVSEIAVLQPGALSVCVSGARARLGLPDAGRRGGSAPRRPDLDRAVDVRELLRAEGAAGADDRDADPGARSQGPLHGRSCATRRHVLRIRRYRVRASGSDAWNGCATPR